MGTITLASITAELGVGTNVAFAGGSVRRDAESLILENVTLERLFAIGASRVEYPVVFRSCCFVDTITMKDVVFEKSCNFVDCEFEGDFIAKGTKFVGDVAFSKCVWRSTRTAILPRVIDFELCTFGGRVEFAGSRIECRVSFDESVFNGPAIFDICDFEKHVSFVGATFDRRASLSHARCRGDVDLSQLLSNKSSVLTLSGAVFERDIILENAVIEGNVDLTGCIVLGDARFGGMSVRGLCVFSDADFRRVPKIASARFSEVPSLIDLKLPATGDADEAVQFRALKKLAMLGGDHEGELHFFACELRADRRMRDGDFVGRIVDAVFAICSDYGRSYFRPLALWFGTWLISTALYCGLPSVLSTPVPSIYTIGEVLNGTARCSNTDERVLSVAAHLALKNGLLFIGWESSDRIKMSNACLFGVSISNEVYMPIYIATISLLQTIVSGLAIFLFALSIRNHFKIA